MSAMIKKYERQVTKFDRCVVILQYNVIVMYVFDPILLFITTSLNWFYCEQIKLSSYHLTYLYSFEALKDFLNMQIAT